ncbi:hypothetical protein JCM6882_005662 [Rhodosporidiobolus microsporus]
MLRSLRVALLALCAGQGALAEEQPSSRSLTVYHRFVSSTPASPTFFSASDGAWIERGRIEVSSSPSSAGEDTASFIASPDTWKDLTALSTSSDWAGNAAQVGGERYQVAVRDPAWEGEEGGELSFVSVDPCKLYTASSTPLDESLTLSWTSSPAHNGAGIFAGALDYRTSTADDSPACDIKASEKQRKQYKFGPLVAREGKEGKVVVKLVKAGEVKPEEPVRPKQAKEQQPVRLDEEGKVIPPPAEKSFVQKYWMYIVPALLILMIGGGDPPKDGGGEGGGGGAKQ